MHEQEHMFVVVIMNSQVVFNLDTSVKHSDRTYGLRDQNIRREKELGNKRQVYRLKLSLPDNLWILDGWNKRLRFGA